MTTIKIGTRSSPLAVWQANWIKSQLEEIHSEVKPELVYIKTSGDKILDVPLAKIGGKGLFVKEIEEALLREEIDLAVHSVKDMPVKLPPGLCLAAVPQREDPHDALISRDNVKLAELPDGARVGTGSMRRQTQLKNFRPDIEIIPLRGNIETRIKKLETENLDAVILAAAGLHRMGWQEKITETIDSEILLPAVGQGAVGIEARHHGLDILEFLIDLDHDPTHIAVEAERSFLRTLQGGCQVPIGVHATLDKDKIHIRGLVGSLDGKVIHKSEIRGSTQDAKLLGKELGLEVLKMGADKILKEIYNAS